MVNEESTEGTVEQREPLPFDVGKYGILLIAFVAMVALAVIFGPGIMAGMSESSITTDTTDTGTGGTDTGTNVVPAEKDKIGEIGVSYSIDNLPQKILSEKRPDINLVNVRIENNVLKFSVAKNDYGEFDMHYDVKVVAYRGEPHNREITYSFLSDRVFIEKGQEEKVEGDLSLLELQSADSSSGELQKTSCEIKKIMFYFE